VNQSAQNINLSELHRAKPESRQSVDFNQNNSSKIRIQASSQSSDYASGGLPLQYPRVVADLDRKQQEKHQAAKIEAHSPQTAQILKA